MHARSILACCGLAWLGLLAGCDPRRSDPPKPAVMPSQGVGSISPAAGGDTSVPPAASVVGVSPPAVPAAPPGRTNSTMTRAEETGAMPLPGQNNDHSAPLAVPKPAAPR